MMQTHRLRHAAVRAHAVLCLALLAACGGGGGPVPPAATARSDDAVARRASAEATLAPLNVVSSVPGDGGDHTPRDRQPSFTFSAPLDPATVHGGTFLLRTGASAVPTDTRVVDRVAQLLPPGRLLPQTRYTVRAEPGLRDLSGQTLAAPVERSFVTADAIWRPTLRVPGSESRLLRDVAVTLDTQGQAFAAWDGGPATLARARVQVAHSLPGGGWSSPTVLFDDAGQTGDVKMVADRAGNVLLVWQHLNDIPGVVPYTVIWAARFEKATGLWTAPVVVSHTDGSHNGQMQVAMASNGDAAVAWERVEAVSRKGSVWIAMATLPAGRWTIPHRIDNPADDEGRVAELSLATALGGRTVAVWRARTNNANAIEGIWARVIDGRPPGRTPARVISNDNGDPEWNPGVVVDAIGHVYVAWRQSGPGWGGNSFSNIWLAHHDHAAWRSRRLLSGLYDRVWSPRIATGLRVNGTPSTWVSWTDGDAGLAWVTPVSPDSAAAPRVIAAGQVFPGAVSLAVDRAGNVRALWTTTAASGGVAASVMSARYVERLGQWSAPLLLDNVDVANTLPIQLTVNAVGDGVAAWQGLEPIPGNGVSNLVVRTRRFD